MDLGLEGRVVLVTGGSRGIGQATAMLFARESARVALTYHTNGARADEVAAQLVAEGGEALSVQLDLLTRHSRNQKRCMLAHR